MLLTLAPPPLMGRQGGGEKPSDINPLPLPLPPREGSSWRAVPKVNSIDGGGRVGGVPRVNSVEVPCGAGKGNRLITRE